MAEETGSLPLAKFNSERDNPFWYRRSDGDDQDFRLRPGERDTLKRWLRWSTTPSGLTRRARILLALDGDRGATETSKLLHVGRSTVHLWHRRYVAEGLDG